MSELSTYYDIVCTQSDPLWKEHRWSGWSASVIPSLLGVNKWEQRTKAEIIRDHAAKFSSYDEDNASTQAGIRLERPILDWAQELTGKKVDSWQELLRSKKHPWLLATPDGVSVDGLIECKCTSPWVGKAWQESIPEYVAAQVQAQMAVTGHEHADVVHWYWGAKPALYPLERNNAHIDAIINITGEAWEQVQKLRTK